MVCGNCEVVWCYLWLGFDIALLKYLVYDIINW